MTLPSSQWDGVINENAQKKGLRPEFLKALLYQESRFNPEAMGPVLKKRKAGDQQAVGIAQIMPSTASDYGLTAVDLKDPNKSIELAANILSKHLQKYQGDERLAAAAYNWGPGNVDKHLKANGGKANEVKFPKETRGYLKNIFQGQQQKLEIPKPEVKRLFGETEGIDQGRLQAASESLHTERTAEIEQLHQTKEEGLIQGVGGALAAAFRTNNIVYQAYQNSKATEVAYDGFGPSEEDLAWLDTQTEGPMRDLIRDNWRGRDNVQTQLSMYQQRALDDAETGKYGAAAKFIINTAAALTSPENIALSLVPGGALARVGLFASRGVAAQIASHAIVGAAGNVVAEGLASQMAGREVDYGASAALGAGFGVFGGLIAHRMSTIPNAANRTPELDAAARGLERDFTAHQLQQQGIETFPTEHAPQSPHNILNPIYKDAEQEFDKSYGIMRYDVVGKLMKTENQKLRSFASTLSPDQTLRGQATTIAEFQDMSVGRDRGTLRELDSLLHGARPGIHKNPELLREEGKKIANAVMDRTGVSYSSADPHIRKAADLIRTDMAEKLNTGKGLGIFNHLDIDRHYFPMRATDSGVQTAVERFGSKDKLIENTTNWALRHLDDDYVKTRWEQAIAEGKVTKDTSLDSYRHSMAEGWARTKIETSYDTDIMRGERTLKGSDPSFTEHAVKMNRAGEIVGTDGQAFSLWDLTDGNLWSMYRQYSRQYAAEFSVRMRHGKPANEVLKELQDALNSDSKITTTERAKLLKTAKDGLTQAMGFNPHYSDHNGIKALGIARNYAYSLSAGGFGLNTIGEAAGAVSMYGWRAAKQLFTGIDPVLKKVKMGDREAILQLKAMEEFGAWDSMRRSLGDTLADRDDVFKNAKTGLEKAGNIAGRLGKLGSNLVTKYSGFDFFQKNISEGMRLQAMVDLNAMARGEKNGLTKFVTPERLSKYGLDERSFKKILDDVKKYQDKGGFFDSGKWKKDSLDTFIQARTLIERVNREMTQKHHANDLPQFMNTPVGQLLFQFQSFPMAAWTNATLPLVKDHDRIAIGKFLGTALGGAMVYMSRMGYNSLSQDDPQAYRDKYLDEMNVAVVGFGRSSTAAWIPSALGPVAGMGGFDVPGLTNMRTTGTDSTSISPPALQALTRLVQVGSAGAHSILDPDYEWTKEQSRSLKSAVVPNLMPIGLMLDTMSAKAEELF
ncbi:lytic transglycosylase domain-containing protein [Chromobacterium haemolyticum]|uniref:lytic transglycosylase domain-containing protein n=1 Tax=Chromobacterium TaxID=535 RepID=UPI004055BFE6